MLCPEGWNFNPPSDIVNVCSGYVRNLNHCENLINHHYYNHNVSVVLPGCQKIPEDLIKNLKDDCDYYKVILPVSQLIERDFINLFILTGELSALSEATQIDIDDCICVTPSGFLVLSVTKETYQQLGLEGVVLGNERYAITINLKESSFKPGKPNYDRVYRSLTQFLPLKFDFIISWEPPSDCEICPSSIAKFLHSKGHDVRVCSPVFSYKTEENIIIPSIKSAAPEELIEWLGAFSLYVFKKDDSLSSLMSKFLSDYDRQFTSKNRARVIVFQWTGFFTNKKTALLFQSLWKYVQSEIATNIPWVSLNVSGFGDAPVLWKLKHNLYTINRDDHYTIFVQPDKYMVTFNVSASSSKNNKVKKKWNFQTFH